MMAILFLILIDLHDWKSGWKSNKPAQQIKKNEKEEEKEEAEIRRYEGARNTLFMIELNKRIKTFLSKLEESHPQYGLIGEDHLWIMKPGQSSRGRGIQVLNDYDSIMQNREKHRSTKWVIQKYMENSLLIKGRKFDIRQWVKINLQPPILLLEL